MSLLSGFFRIWDQPLICTRSTHFRHFESSNAALMSEGWTHGPYLDKSILHMNFHHQKTHCNWLPIPKDGHHVCHVSAFGVYHETILNTQPHHATTVHLGGINQEVLAEFSLSGTATRFAWWLPTNSVNQKYVLGYIDTYNYVYWNYITVWYSINSINHIHTNTKYIIYQLVPGTGRGGSFENRTWL